RRDGADERVRVWYRAGRGAPLAAVHQDGLDAGRAMPDVDAAVRAGRPVLVVEAFQTGESVTPRTRDVSHFLTFNQSDDQARVQDVVTALRWFSEVTRATAANDGAAGAAVRNGGRGGAGATTGIELIGAGHARFWAALAAIVAPTGAVDVVHGVDG